MATGGFTCCCAVKVADQPQEDLSRLSRDGPATAQQDTQASGQGEAAGGAHGRDASERDLGDGLRARSIGDRPQDPGADGSRYLLALRAGDRPRLSYRGEDVVQVLEKVCARVGYPTTIRVDQGTEFVSRDLDLWAYTRGVTLDFSRPGKPTDNAFIEAFNGRFRAECLNVHWFMSLEDARQRKEAWRKYYNEERPHGAIGQKTPITLLARDGTSSPPS
jgi:putative transposase